MKAPQRPGFSKNDAALAVLLVLFLLVAGISMTAVLQNSVPGHENFWSAVAGTLLLAGFIPLFVLARFSFGYVVGISFYWMIISFFWYTYFTVQHYDHVLARWSAVASLLLFLLPVLFQTIALPRRLALSPRGMNRLLLLLLGAALLTLAWSASYGFAFVGLQDSERLRAAILRPGILNYLIGALTGAVLPFAFAYFAWHGRYVLAALAVLLIAGFYPVVLNKSVVFGAVWLPFLFVMFKAFEPKRATILALLIPVALGLLIYELVPSGGRLGYWPSYVFGTVNVRFFAFPAIAMDRYSDFFASHPLTHFCQIGIVRAIYGCPYPFQLGVAMAEAYHLGNLNASLFATEGIASVGPLWAPISALVCGLMLSVGNSASARLPPPLLAASAGLAVQQALLNVPLSANLLSNGALVLWLLWAVTPEMAGSTAPLPGIVSKT